MRAGRSSGAPGSVTASVPFLRSGVVSILERLLLACARPMAVTHTEGCYLVIAPHPDDETLGCGATIARARTAGIPVHVVVVTDGSGHPKAVADKASLAAVRRRETLHACGVLGVPASHVEFFDIPDGLATAHVSDVADRLREVIGRLNPARIFSPFGLDNHADHRAVAAVVHDLVRQAAVTAELYQYPIWFWFPRFLLSALLRGEFLRIRRVSTSGFLDLKRRALASHASQAGAFDPTDAILTPEFLRRFLRPDEYFFEQSHRGGHGR